MDKKALLAFILCAIVTIYMFQFLQPAKFPEGEEKEVVSEEMVTVKEKRELDTFAAAQEEQGTKDLGMDVAQEEVELQDAIVLQNDVIRSVWTNSGAALKSAVLTAFKEPGKRQVLELLKPAKRDFLPLSLRLQDDKYHLKIRRYKVVEQSSNRIVFTTLLENGLRITKDISLNEGKYFFDIKIILENVTGVDLTTSYSIIASNGIYPEYDSYSGLGSVAGIDVGHDKVKLFRTDYKDLPYKNESVGISWAGSVNKYFASILKSSTNGVITTSESSLFENNDPLYDKDFTVSLQTNKVVIPPQGEERHGWLFFLGPKKEEFLNQSEGLSVLLDYGWTTAICKVLVKILNTFYSVIPNYGIAILLLTILVKLVLFPLTRKSQMSMFKMQRLQPLIGQLKEKYKGDKQRMGQEQMKLFKEQGVNPMSGCLPIVFQMPVFFALFRTLQLSFEMRQTPFVAWIDDLSMPDTLIQLSFSMPFLGDGVNVLPLVMGIASFVQMKLTPKTGGGDDPQAKMQQKMMQIMPLIFPLILYKFPSGLTLYWTTSTLISICEQMFIRRSVKKIDVYYKGKRVITGKTAE
ncbi:MAG: membrane protein insertase YidC [Candidatus Scalindua sp. AMX11]|nr:MAG: membrane protein insertase YidC [Candidatus Scalindua sp.]NOG83843.1 membrane protein insertase YidC [Planctomycetota bacterium]RZV82995.1 MAG: membrane protein insertase YidC [Candidatus Scalindua sp. SCAELEC01]TDE64498.1 MAG: membrane protein insertase YidC [Candidatus Scalindua sp. AMX11]GJQ58761.1 MAG: membrane protein insertase YidC [Candidatus Scalindua sp.]